MTKRLDQHGRRWRVRWQVDGQPQQRSFQTKAEAETFLAELEASLAKLKADVETRRTNPFAVHEVVNAYYERRKRGLQASTQHHYEQIIRKHIRPKIGSLNARALADDPSALQDFYDDLPPTTALHAHQILRPAFQHAVDHRRLDRNPCAIARPPRKRRPEKLIPTSDEVAKIVLKAQERDATFGLFVWLVARLGLRRGEACALRWEDFRPGTQEIHIRRTIARKSGGTYIKAPKSGESRTIRMDIRFFDKLANSQHSDGWLFPRGYNCPYENRHGLSPISTAGRFLKALAEHDGVLTSATGSAGIEAARLIGLGKQSALPMLRRLTRDSYVVRIGNRSRTYEIALTELGSATVAAWSDNDQITDLPWFPTTADEKFAKLVRELALPYTLHSLRHFVATHLYNRNRDWVQLARFLGHSSPAITMNLYANHVVDASQLALGEAAMDLFDDPDL